jgi:hypothetical protein
MKPGSAQPAAVSRTEGPGWLGDRHHRDAVAGFNPADVAHPAKQRRPICSAVRRAPLLAGGPRTARGLSPLAAGLAALPAVLPRRDPHSVKGWHAHRDLADGGAADPGKLDDLLPSMPHVVADRACCCPARPVVTVIMPPAPGRPHPVDLLLCGHHFRASQAALTAAGAAVYDDTGALVAGGVSGYEHDLREHAAAA